MIEVEKETEFRDGNQVQHELEFAVGIQAETEVRIGPLFTWLYSSLGGAVLDFTDKVIV